MPIHFFLALHLNIDTPQILPLLVNYGRTNTFVSYPFIGALLSLPIIFPTFITGMGLGAELLS